MKEQRRCNKRRYNKQWMKAYRAVKRMRQDDCHESDTDDDNDGIPMIHVPNVREEGSPARLLNHSEPKADQEVEENLVQEQDDHDDEINDDWEGVNSDIPITSDESDEGSGDHAVEENLVQEQDDHDDEINDDWEGVNSDIPITSDESDEGSGDHAVEENLVQEQDDHDDEINDDLEGVNSDIPITSDESDEGSDDHAGGDVDHPVSLRNELTTWSNDHQIKHHAVDGLLKILKRHGHADLPCTARTLLGTTKHVEVKQVSGMDYVYLGLVEELTKAYKHCKKKIGDAGSISIAFNIDGIPLFKSSSSCLWPVLGSIANVAPPYVFTVAITYGTSKPNNLDFLADTIRDLKTILRNGLVVDGEIVTVHLKCIVCDAPARAFVKSSKLYSGYFGCDKCAQKGEWHGRVTYQQTRNLPKRTDVSFRSKTNEEHHNGETPLTQLTLDMVKGYPIDYMHQSCLGTMRKLLLIWMRGKGRLLSVRMSVAQIQIVSEKLRALRCSITNEFQRKPRSLFEIDRWKATELRQFLLYTGKIVLCDILRQDVFEHFMALSVATSILVSPALAADYSEFADQLMVYFNEQGRVLYGPEFLVYNVHAMLHTADEAQEFGDLDSCSGFPFENFLQFLKKLVRSGNRPIVQIVKRLSERDVTTVILKETKNISCTKPNNCYVLNDFTCCEVQQQTNNKDDNDDTNFLCRVYTRSDNTFERPCNSRLIGVQKVHNRNSSMKLIPKRRLKTKAMKFDLDRNTSVFMALLHQM